MKIVYNDIDSKMIIDLSFNICTKDYFINSAQKDPHNPHALLLKRVAISYNN